MQTIDSVAQLLALNEPDERLVKRICQVGKSLTAIGLGMSFAAPLSWILNRPVLRPDIPSLTGAHLLNSVFVTTLALSIVLFYRRTFIAGSRILWTIIALASAIVVLEYLTPNELPFASSIRFLDPAENSSKIAPNAAFCQMFLVLGMLMISRRDDLSVRIGQLLTLVAAIVPALALIGHAYTIESLYGVGDYSALSVPGSIAFLSLCFAVLIARPESGIIRIISTRSAAGVMSRALYAPVIVLPPVLGFLALVSAEVWKWYSLPFGIAVFAILSILLIAGVVAFTSVRLEDTDLSRAKAEQQLGETIEQLEDSREQLRELSAHIQEVQEEERLRIAREVHDELGQSLTALKMDVALLKNDLGAQANQTSNGHGPRIDSMLSLVNSTIHSVQRISAELRPSLLDDLGLAAAIEWQAREFDKRSGVTVTVDVEDVEIDRPRAIALFRIFQETLTNIGRHAEAEHVEVSLRISDGMLTLRVHDDGVGFVAEEKLQTLSLGLLGMRERAALAGGELIIESTPGNGATVSLQMPIHHEQLAAV